MLRCVYFIQERSSCAQKRRKSLFNFNYSQIETVALLIYIEIRRLQRAALFLLLSLLRIYVYVCFIHAQSTRFVMAVSFEPTTLEQISTDFYALLQLCDLR